MSSTTSERTAVGTELRLEIGPRGEALEQALACEESVFLEAFGNTREQLDYEYGPYQDASEHLAIYEPGGQAIAHMRLIEHSPAGLKTLEDCSREPWRTDGYRAAQAAGVNIAQCWDIGTIGVRREWRRTLGMQTSLALFHALNQAMIARDKTHLIAIFDEKVRRGLTLAGLHVATLPGMHAGEYLGSEKSTPVWGSRTGILARQKSENPMGWRAVALGAGLEAISMPRDW